MQAGRGQIPATRRKGKNMNQIPDMKTHDFYYDLPEELIAQTPAEPRECSWKGRRVTRASLFLEKSASCICPGGEGAEFARE